MSTSPNWRPSGPRSNVRSGDDRAIVTFFLEHAGARSMLVTLVSDGLYKLETATDLEVAVRNLMARKEYRDAVSSGAVVLDISCEGVRLRRTL